MKIVVVGGTGRIGQAIVEQLASRHELVIASHQQGNVKVDITDPQSIESMYKQIKSFDAMVCAAGRVKFADLNQMTTQDFAMGLKDKLMGQINLVLIGLRYINKNGSFTLTSGILNKDPIPTGSSAAMVNGAIDGFVKAAAIEMPNGIRINAVSPTVIAEAMDVYGAYFRGYDPVPVAKAALAYSKSIEGLQTGQVFRVGY